MSTNRDDIIEEDNENHPARRRLRIKEKPFELEVVLQMENGLLFSENLTL